jgi:hypothetical protein
MSKFHTVAVPFKQLGNRQVLTHEQLTEEPWLMDFVRQFPDCFEEDLELDCLVFDPKIVLDKR